MSCAPARHDLRRRLVGRDGYRLRSGDRLGLAVLLALLGGVARSQLVLAVREEHQRLTALRGADAVVDQLLPRPGERCPVVGLKSSVAAGEVGHG
jgi:hypothetical protein